MQFVDFCIKLTAKQGEEYVRGNFWIFNSNPDLCNLTSCQKVSAYSQRIDNL